MIQGSKAEFVMNDRSIKPLFRVILKPGSIDVYRQRASPISIYNE